MEDFLESFKLLLERCRCSFASLSEFCNKHKNVILTAAFVLFAILTIFGIIYHEPWFDEAQAWLIAKNLSFIELLKYMKYEGHMFVWFALLMPFAKLNIPYPLPMQIVNLLCIWGAVYVLLKKAPFHPLLKILIMFSAPICFQYAVIARCYSCGILLLFLLAALYKDKLKHPYWYAILIALCANTSVMALFGAAAFGGLFLFDYIKAKPEFYKSKEFYVLSLIAVFTIAILGYQLLGVQNQQRELLIDAKVIIENPDYFKQFLFSLSNGLFCINNHWKYLLVPIYLLLSVILYRKDKKCLFFWTVTLTGLSLVFLFLYNGFLWHHLFFFVYFVISFWLYCLNSNKNKYLYYPLLIFLFIVTIRMDYISYLDYVYNTKAITSNSESMAYYIQYKGYAEKGNLIICNDLVYSVVPYLDNLNIPIYNCTDKKQNYFFDRSSDMNMYLKSTTLSPKYFKKFEDKDIYLLATNNRLTQFYSDYYMLDLEFCTKFTPGDGQLCLIKLTPGYENE